MRLSEKTKKSPSKTYNYLFSNMKAILMASVVAVHLLEQWPERTRTGLSIWLFFYIFVMPAFMFVSGYFSKDLKNNHQNIIEKYLLPYIVMTCYICLSQLIVYGTTSFSLIKPVYMTWYWLALAIYKVVLNDFIKIRYIIPISFVISAISGCFSTVNSTLTIGRGLSFFPFFLLGYFCTEQHIKMIKKLPKAIGYTVLIFSLVLCYIIARFANFSNVLSVALDFDRPFSDITFENYYGVLFKACFLVFALIIIYGFIIVLPQNKTFISYMGDNTVTVYSFHAFFIMIVHKFHILSQGRVLPLIIIFVLTVLIMLLLSIPSISRAYRTFLSRCCNLIIK